MSRSTVDTKPRAPHIDVEAPPPPPHPKSTRGRLRTVTERFRTFQSQLPQWSILVLLVFFIGPIIAFEPVFGDGVGAIAAGVGVLVGSGIAWASTRWRWDTPTTLIVMIASYFLLGTPVALRSEALFGVLPTGQSLQVMVLGSFRAWKDLLTLQAPVSVYSGPALVPWITGLVCATLAGVLTVRTGRAFMGSLPVILMAVLALFFGRSGQALPVWAALVWWALLVGWWAWAAQYQRISLGQDILVGRRGAAGVTSTGNGGGQRAAVYASSRVIGGVITLVMCVALALPLASSVGANGRIVGRDLVTPPLNLQDYPSPLSSFRHYTTDLRDETLLSVSDLPENQRVRIAAMDVYDGTTFGMSSAQGQDRSGYIPVETSIPGREQGTQRVTVTTNELSGPWVPILGSPSDLTFSGDNAREQQRGLFVDTWANAALTTGPAGTMVYDVNTSFTQSVRDEELEGRTVVPLSTRDTNVPESVGARAIDLTQNASTSLQAARAIEHYLSTNGYYLNENTQFSRPGVRADRLERMLSSDENLIGDDQQYAALMTLMVHQLGMNARVVMGAYPEGGAQGGAVDLRGSDMRAWVEIEFSGGVWAVFDPTPPRDHTPQTQVPQPRSVPRPQVLQPPEPPEMPAELPPATRDQNADPEEPPKPGLPWGRIAAGAGGILIFLSPPFLILLYKAARRRSRRRAAPPQALLGSWDEVVDMATDGGIRIQPGQTRQETAWFLASQWELGVEKTDGFSHVGGVQDGEDTSTASAANAPDASTYIIDGWSQFGDEVPTTVAIARYADVANFAANGASRDRARAAWEDVAQLRARVEGKKGFIKRMVARLSLRSLWSRWRMRSRKSGARRKGRS